MRQYPVRRTTRRRAAAVASGFAALVLVAGACGNGDDAEDAVADATSAVESVATEATSAVASVADEATSAVADAGDRDHDHDRDHADDHPDADRAFLDEVRAGGVEVHDDADFLIRGHDACRAIEDGESYDAVLQSYVADHPEADNDEARVVVQAAVNAFCPDYQPVLNN